MHVKVVSHKPHVLVNGTIIITKDGTSVPPELFAQSVRFGRLDGVEQVSHGRVIKFIRSLADSVLNQFDVSWKNSTYIVYTDKQHPLFALVSTVAYPPNGLQLAGCQKIKRWLAAQGNFNDTSDATWIADVRFDKQIIVRRGNRNG